MLNFQEQFTVSIREKLEGFPEHAVPPVDILRSQGIAFRFPEFERNAYAAAAGQDDALALRFTATCVSDA